MAFISIFNDVLGPVMRGPSSSHTAGSYHIGCMVRSLLDEEPRTVDITFDINGSYARVFRQQGSDLALISGLLGISLTDNLFFQAYKLGEERGLSPNIQIIELEQANHPNFVLIKIIGKNNKALIVEAQSIGGGMVKISSINGYKVSLSGKAEEHVVICNSTGAEKIISKMEKSTGLVEAPHVSEQKSKTVIHILLTKKLRPDEIIKIKSFPGFEQMWTCSPIFFPKKGEELFASTGEMLHLAKTQSLTLGEIALFYETNLLGISKKEALEEMLHRYKVMQNSVIQGLDKNNVKMQLLEPTADKITQKIKNKTLPIGGLHTRAATRAMAVMHINNSMGIVCAAPTGGSAGTIPGVITTLVDEKKMNSRQIAMSLFAASAIGLIVAHRATFAAESAGCQVEIGAAGAMAAAAVVESAGGSAKQACDAAAISFQNTMGSVCDLVKGICEIPCHTRNAVAASGAYVCADLILGGYVNPIPLDETIDAVYSVGKMLPPELRCTALGGLAQTPTGQKLHIRDIHKDHNTKVE